MTMKDVEENASNALQSILEQVTAFQAGEGSMSAGDYMQTIARIAGEGLKDPLVREGGISDVIEQEIDRHGFASLTDMIATIARAKADHIRENWQDGNLASIWNRAAGQFDRLTYEFTMHYKGVLGAKR